MPKYFLMVLFIMVGVFSSVHAQEYTEDYGAGDSEEWAVEFFSECELESLSTEEQLDDDAGLCRELYHYFKDQVIRKREAIVEARSVFQWQRIATRMGFIISHLFVLIALTAAVLEFVQARRLRELGIKAETSEIKVGLDGIAVKSSLFGILLLISAMGFYFLYLRYVYPVTLI